jgi:hypothetical protein
MKRLILLIVVVMLAYWVFARHRLGLMHPAGPAHRGSHYAQDREARRHVVARAGNDVKQALREAGHDIRNAVGEASEDIHHAIDEVRGAVFPEDDDARAVVEREDADGLPVKIVPGTRVTEAQAVPPVSPPSALTKRFKSRVIGPARPVRPERADNAARAALREEVTAWLDPDVPSSWSLPDRELDLLVVESKRETIAKEYGPMYITHLKLDTTQPHRDKIVKLYNRELVGHRLINLGGSLTFILMCLAAVSGYIRADEATKGYYTNRLRMLAAVAVGAGGVLIYQMIT